MKINDVFFQNSNLLSSINDSSGLWLFANFKKDCFIEALRVGFMLGFYEGIDYGIKSIIGDPNKYADLVMFDFDKLKENEDYRKPTKTPEGIKYVFINGKIVCKEGIFTGKRAGKVLKKRKGAIG